MTDERLTEFSNGELVFDVIDEGPRDGTPVVLLHGFPQRASAWNDVAAALHERGARTFALDQRGYSPRARPRSRFGYRVSALASDVETLVAAIGGPVHLVGHDWGAGVAWAVASSHPGSVSSLTAVSVPHPAAFVSSFTRSSQLLKSYYMLLFQLPGLPEWLLSRRSGFADRLLRNSGMSTEMIKTYHTEIVADGALRGGLGYYRSIPLTRRRDMPGRIAVPTTYVWSDGDVAISRTSAELTARFVTGEYRFEVMKSVTHWIPEERPVELAEIIAQRVGL